MFCHQSSMMITRTHNDLLSLFCQLLWINLQTGKLILGTLGGHFAAITWYNGSHPMKLLVWVMKWECAVVNSDFTCTLNTCRHVVPMYRVNMVVHRLINQSHAIKPGRVSPVQKVKPHSSSQQFHSPTGSQRQRSSTVRILPGSLTVIGRSVAAPLLPLSDWRGCCSCCSCCCQHCRDC